MRALIYVETKDGNPLAGSLELFSAAASLDAACDAVLVGKELKEAAEEAAAYGAKKVFLIEAPMELTEEYLTEALSRKAAEQSYDLILASATPAARSVFPVLAEKQKAGYVSDVTAIRTESSAICCDRPVYGGTVCETRRILTSAAVLTVRAGSFDKPQKKETAAAEVVICEGPDEASLRTKITGVIAETVQAVDVTAAKIVVTAGRGMSTEQDFHLVEELAEAFGGVVGGTRPVIEEGLLPRQQQVGQSGKIVNPDLYIAVGVSGAPQHISGMAGSRFILAINRDEEAPIMNIADVAIVGDAKQIVPLLIEEAKKVRA